MGNLDQDRSKGAHRMRAVFNAHFTRLIRSALPIAAGGDGDASEVVERAGQVARQLLDMSGGPAGGG